MPARISFTSNFDARRARARALELQAQAADDWLRDWLAWTRSQWTGWVVETGKSRRGFDGVVHVRGSEITTQIINPVPYVPFVHRAGSSTPEIEVVRGRIFGDLDAYARGQARALAQAIDEERA